MDENNNDVIRENGNQIANKKNNGAALASFILGIVSLLIAGIPCGIAALITGIVGLTKFDSEKEKNKWMAIVGILLGIVGAVSAALLVPIVLKDLNL